MDIPNLSSLAIEVNNVLVDAKRKELWRRIVCDVRGSAHNAVQILADYAAEKGVAPMHGALCYWWELTWPRRDRATLGTLYHFVEQDAGVGIADRLRGTISLVRP